MKRKKGIVFGVLLVALIAAGAWYYYLENTTFDTVQVIETHESIGADNGKYIKYADYVLKYSKDGVALLTQEGDQLWNHPCQMVDPIVEKVETGDGRQGKAFAVADLGGTSILVCEKDGLKGEINTTRPIEEVAVSEQGIVAAILRNADTPQIICYDAKGNILVEHMTSLENTGYPLDIAISQDGKTLLVSYLYIEGNSMNTKTVFYHFGAAGEEKPDHLVAQAEYKDTVIPITAFIGPTKSLLVSDHSLILFEGLENPKEEMVIELEGRIKSVAYSEKYIACVLEGTAASGYELRIYDVSGKQVGSAEFDEEYLNIEVTGRQIVLFSTNACAIYNEKGVCKYQGIFENEIINLFPISGLNKYMRISASGFEEIQLVK